MHQAARILAFDWTGIRDGKATFVQLTLSTGLLIFSVSQLLSSPGTGVFSLLKAECAGELRVAGLHLIPETAEKCFLIPQ